MKNVVYIVGVGGVVVGSATGVTAGLLTKKDKKIEGVAMTKIRSHAIKLTWAEMKENR